MWIMIKPYSLFYHTILTDQVNLNKKSDTPPSGEMELTGRGTIVDYPLLAGIALSFSAKSTFGYSFRQGINEVPKGYPSKKHLRSRKPTEPTETSICK